MRDTDHLVRLFPTAHITSEREAELRATAALLSMVMSVSEFGRAVVRAAGGPAGQLECLTEVPMQLQKSPREPPTDLRPDGLIRARRGKTRWKALVEVKVGDARLEQEQIALYHRLAKQEGFHALITISNQPVLPDGSPPIALDGRRLRSVPVTHFSWDRLLSRAQMLSRKKAVSDPDQSWMLDEWIRFVDDSESKIIVPPDLGPHWTPLLKAAKTGDLAAAGTETDDVVEHWLAYIRKVCLRLRAKLGVDVHPRVSRPEREDVAKLQARLRDEVRDTGVLSTALRVPDAAGDVGIEVFLPSRYVRYSLEVRPPGEGRQLTRLNWLARQLRRANDLPPSLQLDVVWPRRGLVCTGKAAALIDEPNAFLCNREGIPIPKDLMPRRFVLSTTGALLKGRSRSTAPILEGVSKGLEGFYRDVVEGITAWTPPTPRLPEADPTPGSEDDAGHDEPPSA